MIRLSELRNQLKSQNLDTVQPAAFKQVGGVVFPDTKAKLDLLALREIINGFQNVHLPSYGHSIAGSSYAKVTSITDATVSKLLEPDINEVYRVDTLNVMSSEASTDVSFLMSYPSDVGTLTPSIIAPQTITPLNTEILFVTPSSPIIVSYPQTLQVKTDSSGTVDTTVLMGYTKLQQ